ncbi:hypothetical protein FZC74_07025 [Sutcliffiella horikoshii]|uniref:Uncharacterized protein n=1 Tax=Sutcliffiella horikoshii TaxID=79883 RepID=A0AA95B6Z1_9BACI|nr:hypothetical protein [Sutcliffiella horikoshii]TYS59901.1 hypothetical protein FZC74_07025 [Sutcliffiella horikoshii]
MRKLSIAYLILFTISTSLKLFLVYKDVNHPYATAMVYFLIFFGLSFLINFNEPNLYKSISIAFGMSIGLSFFSLVLLPKKIGSEV